MAVTIDRAKVQLRPLAEGDVDDILLWVNDPGVVGNLAVFAGKPITREQELDWIRQVTKSESDRVFTVLDGTDDIYAGQVGVHQIHWRSKVGRLGCIIGSKAKMGRGLGSAAVAHALDVAFGELGLHKVWLMVFEENTRSRGVYERIGFVVEGTLREEYFHNDGWHNMVRMSLLAHEWNVPA